MKIGINESIAVEVEVEDLSNAGILLGDLNSEHPRETIDGLLVLLLFRELEKNKPGIIAELQTKLQPNKKR